MNLSTCFVFSLILLCLCACTEAHNGTPEVFDAGSHIDGSAGRDAFTDLDLGSVLNLDAELVTDGAARLDSGAVEIVDASSSDTGAPVPDSGAPDIHEGDLCSPAYQPCESTNARWRCEFDGMDNRYVRDECLLRDECVQFVTVGGLTQSLCMRRDREYDIHADTPFCDAEDLTHRCDDGHWAVNDECGPDYACAVDAIGNPSCVDNALVACDRTTFLESCDGNATVVCSSAGYVVTQPCGAFNPLCVSSAGHASCTYAGAESCAYDPGAPHSWTCDASDNDLVLGCGAGGKKFRSLRCGWSLASSSDCACRATPSSSDPWGEANCHPVSGADVPYACSTTDPF